MWTPVVNIDIFRLVKNILKQWEDKKVPEIENSMFSYRAHNSANNHSIVITILGIWVAWLQDSLTLVLPEMIVWYNNVMIEL